MNQEFIEAVATNASSKTTYGGAITVMLAWIADINWLGVLGVLIAAGGLTVNIYFQYKRDKREAAEHKARMVRLRGQDDPCI